MKLSIISDIHIKNPGDSAENLLISFLSSEDVQSSDAIILLGDIFDLMIGPHSQYFKRFQRYFEVLKILLQKKIKIYYVEGNHDFHIAKLYKMFFMIHKDLDSTLMSVCSDVEFRDNQKIIYMSHGDEIELGNPGQKIFKKVVTSLPLRIFANNFMPYFLITKVGEFSSEKSRNRNQQRYSKEADMTAVRDNFRKSAEVLGQKRQCNIIVLGHSHVKDHYQSPYGMEYINNGYLQHSKTYICIENGNCTFKNIED